MIGCTVSSLTKVFLLINLIDFIQLQATTLERNEPETQMAKGNDIVDEIQKRFQKMSVVLNIMNTRMMLLNAASRHQETQIANLEKLLETVTHRTEKGNQPKALPHILEIKCPNNQQPQSCYDINECHSNIYSIMMPSYSNYSLAVSCDLKTENGGWTIIQRRQDGSVNFYRNWTEYVEGFGDVNGEFFIGLEKLHILTTQKNKPQELYIILEDFEGAQRYAKYQTFKIDSKDTDYKLTVGNYSGNAGDSLTDHSGEKFSTWDRDNDSVESHCAEKYKGAWWYKSCYKSNLNGKYLMGKFSKSKNGQGVAWGEFRGVDYSLKTVQMMIRPHKG